MRGRAVCAALRDALGLWAGPDLADINGAPFVMGERRRLEELRLAVTEDYFAAELAAGRDAEAVGELERIVDRHRLRERLWELLITALYRSGRQADALAAYQRQRRILAGELGIEPSAPLRQLERDVLLQDAGLAAPSNGPGPGPDRNGDEPPIAVADEESPPAEATVLPRRGLGTVALALGIVALGSDGNSLGVRRHTRKATILAPIRCVFPTLSGVPRQDAWRGWWLVDRPRTFRTCPAVGSACPVPS